MLLFVAIALIHNANVPPTLSRTNMGLSKQGDAVFPHCCPWNQNLARDKGGGDGL